MADLVLSTNLSFTTDTWGSLVNRVNYIGTDLATIVVTTSLSNTAAVTTGNAFVNGIVTVVGFNAQTFATLPTNTTFSFQANNTFLKSNSSNTLVFTTIALADLSNINAAALANNFVLYYAAATNNYIFANVSSLLTTANLTTLNVTTSAVLPTNTQHTGQVANTFLKINGSNTLSFSTIHVADLADTNVGSTANGYVLTYIAGSNTWSAISPNTLTVAISSNTLTVNTSALIGALSIISGTGWAVNAGINATASWVSLKANSITFTSDGGANINLIGPLVANSFTGPLTGNVTAVTIASNTVVANSFTGHLTGNVTAVTIASNTVVANSFTGPLTGNVTGSITGVANTALALNTIRTINFSGDITSTSNTFDGSGNVAFNITLANSGVTSGIYGNSTAYPIVTVDAKGRVTNVSSSGVAPGGVTSFNTRTGAVSLISNDVVTALGFTPVTSNGAASMSGTLTITGADLNSRDVNSTRFITGNSANLSSDIYVGNSTIGSIMSPTTLSVYGTFYANSTALYMSNNTINSPILNGVKEAINQRTASTNAVTLDLSTQNIFDITLANSAVTLTFTNPPANQISYSFTLILRQDATGTRTVVWPSTVKFTDNTIPTITTTASQIDILTLFTLDAGGKYFASYAIANCA